MCKRVKMMCCMYEGHRNKKIKIKYNGRYDLESLDEGSLKIHKNSHTVDSPKLGL